MEEMLRESKVVHSLFFSFCCTGFIKEFYELADPVTIEVGTGNQDAGAVYDFGTLVNSFKPSIVSKAVDADTLSKMSVPSSTAKFTDTVTYENLKSEAQYTLKSIAVDYETGRALVDSSGEYVRANAEFVSEKTNTGRAVATGTASVTLTADTSGLKGKSIVFYEYLVEGSDDELVEVDEYGQVVVPDNAKAYDAAQNNEEQTVHVASIATNVMVASTGTNIAPATEDELYAGDV